MRVAEKLDWKGLMLCLKRQYKQNAIVSITDSNQTANVPTALM
jgi:hypothetical protein